MNTQSGLAWVCDISYKSQIAVPIIIDYSDTWGAVTWVKVSFYVDALDLFSGPHLSRNPSAQYVHLFVNIDNK